MLSRSQEMLGRLQPFMRRSALYKAIFQAESKELDQCDGSTQDLRKQLCIETATWALAIYEKELGIAVQPNKSMDERRAVVKSKIRGTGKADAALIKMVADSYTHGDVDVTFRNSHIGIRFTSIKGIPQNIDDLKQIIEAIIPAHLGYTFAYTYTVWAAVKPLKWGQAREKTWSQLRIYENKEGSK